MACVRSTTSGRPTRPSETTERSTGLLVSLALASEHPESGTEQHAMRSMSSPLDLSRTSPNELVSVKLRGRERLPHARHRVASEAARVHDATLYSPEAGN